MKTSSDAEIRTAIASGDYETALHLWNGYTAQIRDSICQGTLSEEEFAEVRELAQWGRTMLQCSRAHLLDRLNSSYVAGVYASQGGGAPSK